MKEIIIGKNDSDQRVDKFLAKTFKKMPKSLMYKAIRNKKIKVNRKRCEISQRLQEGDTLQLFLAPDILEEEKQLNFLKISKKLDVLYEDQHFIIVNKPKGMLAHKDQEGVQDNLTDRIIHYLYDKKAYDPVKEQSFTPALCHRIDRNTEGIVIAAKTASALREMNEYIKNKEVSKKYVCIVEGVFNQKSDEICLYHKKLDGNKASISEKAKDGYKKMETRYKVLDEKQNYSLVEVELLTGKTHQIRALMAYLHHPLVGDVKYGAKYDGKKSYQMLCAYKVEFHLNEQAKYAYLNENKIVLKENNVFKAYNKL